MPMLWKPVEIVSGVQENRDLFFLREVLVYSVAQWSPIFPGSPCPISFSSEETGLPFKRKGKIWINGVGCMVLQFPEQAVWTPYRWDGGT